MPGASKHTASSRGGRWPVRPKYRAPVKHRTAKAMATVQQDTNPALTHLRSLVDHLEETGHRDMPQVLRAREYLISWIRILLPSQALVPHNK